MARSERIADQLDRHWHKNLRPRLHGLVDEEYFWEPVRGCWSIRPRGTSAAPVSAGSGKWTMDSASPDPMPAPVTTIAWRLAHIIVSCLGAGPPPAPRSDPARRRPVEHPCRASGKRVRPRTQRVVLAVESGMARPRCSPRRSRSALPGRGWSPWAANKVCEVPPPLEPPQSLWAGMGPTASAQVKSDVVVPGQEYVGSVDLSLGVVDEGAQTVNSTHLHSVRPARLRCQHASAMTAARLMSPVAMRLGDIEPQR